MAAAPARILVISLRRIGDLLLTTPLIRSLHHAWPGAEIDVLVFDNTAGIIAGNPDIKRVIGISQRPTRAESVKLLIRLWRSYDIAISTQSGDRPTAFAFAAGRRRIGVTNNDDPWLARMLKRVALHTSLPAAEKIHRVEQMLSLADALGIARVPELVCPAAAEASPIADGGNFAVIHAAPMFAYKAWTPNGWRAIAESLTKRGLAVVAIGGPGEAERRYLDDVWRGALEYHQLEWPQTMNLLARAASLYRPRHVDDTSRGGGGMPDRGLVRTHGPARLGALACRRTDGTLGRERHDSTQRQCVDSAESTALHAVHIRRLRTKYRKPQRVPR